MPFGVSVFFGKKLIMAKDNYLIYNLIYSKG